MNSSDYELQSVLEAQFNSRRASNPRYSLRAFARFLKISPSALGEILRGKRRTSPRLRLRLANQLGLGPGDRERVVVGSGAGSSTVPNSEYILISQDKFDVMSEWHHFAILSLSETKDFESDYDWISQRLGITRIQVEKAVDRLLRLSLLERLKSGKLKGTGCSYTTTDEVKSSSLRRSHAANLDLARHSLENDELCDRDFSAITMTFDPNRMIQAKQELRRFRDRFCVEMEQGQKSEVYKLMIQFIPLTKNTKKKEKV